MRDPEVFRKPKTDATTLCDHTQFSDFYHIGLLCLRKLTSPTEAHSKI